ncbi:MAG: hypothetical protein HY904_00150 [Deltaproteobacteria bacterium]|nr:hypothetical protein [Deltaproteobacteria bacterium]
MAPRKKQAKKTSVRNTVATRANNSRTTQKARKWDVRSGTPHAIMLREVDATPDYGIRLPYAPSLLYLDGGEMVENVDEDLASFAREKMPVTRKHLEVLQEFLNEFQNHGVGTRLIGARTEVISEDALVAMRAVVAARNKLALRASAVGIPLRVFDIRRALGSPRALYGAGLLVVKAATEIVDEFDQPAVARQHIAALKTAVDTLGTVAGLRLKTGLERNKAQAYRRKLVKCLYEYMQWLSGWGRAMAGDDPDAQRRWRLDKTFPNQTKTRGGSYEEAVEHATGDVVDPDALHA